MESTLTELKTTMKGLKSEMKAMEAGLGKVPFPESMLMIKQGSANYYWGEVRNLYDRLKVLTKHEQAEVEAIASGKLQTRYEDLDARVEKALDDYYLDVKARKRDAEIRADAYQRVVTRMEEAEVAEPPAAMNKDIKPKKPVAKKVAKKVVKASAAGASTIKKNLQKKTTKPTMKSSPAKKDEKPYEEPPVEKGQGDLATLNEAIEAEAGKRPPGNPLDLLRALKGIVEV